MSAQNCERCGGTGFEIVRTAKGEGAQPCRCSPTPVASQPHGKEAPRKMRQTGQFDIKRRIAGDRA